MSRNILKAIRKEIYEVRTLKEISKDLDKDKSLKLRGIILNKDRKIKFLRKLLKEMESGINEKNN